VRRVQTPGATVDPYIGSPSTISSPKLIPKRKLHPAVEWHLLIRSLEHSLDLDGPLDGVDDAGERGEDAIFGGIDDSAVLSLDELID
jgi:hypothetical protein